jgi:hypothetical protein
MISCADAIRASASASGIWLQRYACMALMNSWRLLISMSEAIDFLIAEGL